MALLIVNLDKSSAVPGLSRRLQGQVPDLPIRFWPEVGD